MRFSHLSRSFRFGVVCHHCMRKKTTIKYNLILIFIPNINISTTDKSDIALKCV